LVISIAVGFGSRRRLFWPRICGGKHAFLLQMLTAEFGPLLLMAALFAGRQSGAIGGGPDTAPTLCTRRN
jgi:hypothetical protein